MCGSNKYTAKVKINICCHAARLDANVSSSIQLGATPSLRTLFPLYLLYINDFLLFSFVCVGKIQPNPYLSTDNLTRIHSTLNTAHGLPRGTGHISNTILDTQSFVGRVLFSFLDCCLLCRTVSCRFD